MVWPVAAGIVYRCEWGKFSHQFYGEINDAATAKGAEVACAIGGYLAGGVNAREGMLHIDFDEGIQFIVTQLHVIRWLQLLDKLRFEQQCLQFGAEHAGLDLFHILQEPVHLACVAQGMVIVRCQAILEKLCLADIDHLPMLVLHEIYTWFSGEVTFPGRVEKKASRGTRHKDGARR